MALAATPSNKALLRDLYHKGKNGELRVWRVWTEGANICTEHGLVDGQLQVSRKRAEAKNVGRSNETSPEAQAWIEAQAMWKHKLERKYSLTPEEARMPLMLPMLAHTFDPKKHDETCKWLGQPKLDGVRCIARWEGDTVTLMSRQGKPYNLPHISEALRDLLPVDGVFDGELYVHGKPLQETISLVKKLKPESSQ